MADFEMLLTEDHKEHHEWIDDIEAYMQHTVEPDQNPMGKNGLLSTSLHGTHQEQKQRIDDILAYLEDSTVVLPSQSPKTAGCPVPPYEPAQAQPSANVHLGDEEMEEAYWHQPRSTVRRSRRAAQATFKLPQRCVSSLSFATWNVTSALKDFRLNQIRDVITKFDVDVFTLQEPSTDKPLYFKNYREVFTSSSAKFVRIYVKDSIEYREASHDLPQVENCHVVGVEINGGLYSGVYIHPTASGHQVSLFLHDMLGLKHKNVAVIGDWNCRSLSFGLTEGQNTNSIGRAMDQFLELNAHWVPFCPSSPTFVQGIQGRIQSFLDGALCRNSIIDEIQAYQFFPGHKVLVFELSCSHSIPRTKQQDTVNELRCDWKLWQRRMVSESVLSETNEEFMARALNTQQECTDSLGPKQRISRKLNRACSAWWNLSCRKAVIKKNLCYRRMLNAATYSDYLHWESKWKHTRQIVKQVVHRAKEDWSVQVIVSSPNIWESLRILHGRKKKPLPFKDLHQAKSLADDLAKKFRDVGHDVPVISQTTREYIKHLEQFGSIELSDWEIEASIRRAKKRSSVGLDRISVNLLNRMWSSEGVLRGKLRQFLKDLCHYIPDELKVAVIHPIPKNATEYRPISLLSQTIKIVERILAWRLSEICHFANQYCGSGKSTSTAFARLLSVSRKLGDQGVYLFVDIKKAYDRVSYDVLLNKMINFGIPSNIVVWLCHWLTSRSAMVRYQSSYSTPFPVTHGIPQGSPISCVLWKLFMADLRTTLTEFLFMDDLLAATNSHASMERGLRRMEAWATANHVLFNQEKTRIMFSSATEGADHCLFLQGFKIESAASYKYLGIHLGHPLPDGGFDMKRQLASDRKELRQRLNILRALGAASSRNIRCLFFGVYLSKLDYGLVIKEDLVDQLQALQNEALRLISGTIGKGGAKELHKVWRIPTVSERLHQHRLKLYGDMITQGDLLPSAHHQSVQLAKLDGLFFREWLKPSRQACATSYRISRTCTTDGKWESCTELPTHIGQGFCDGGWKAGAILKSGIQVRNMGTAGGLCISSSNTKVPFLKYCSAYLSVHSAYRSECLAMRKMIHSLNSMANSVTHAHVFTDSLSLLTKLKNVFMHCTLFHDPLILDILEGIQQLHDWGVDVTIHWIKAHAGIPGNEAADMLTQDAWDLPYEQFKTDAVTKDSFRQRIHYGTFPWSEFSQLSRDTRTLVCRIVSGEANVAAVTRYYTSPRGPIACRWCHDASETVQHVLFDCMSINSPLFCPQEDTSGRLNKLLDPSNWETIYQFCIARQVIL